MNDVNFVASWRPGADKIYTADAQKVAEEIYAIGEKFEAKDIVDMARDETKESHKLFEWNDEIAGEKYRIYQARHTMHDLQIVEIGLNKEKKPEKIGVPMRMCYSLEGETGYVPTPIIVKDEDLHKKLLMTAKSELNAFMIKYETLTELAPVFEAIRELDIA